MTAEIAIMNKTAIALAADSASTINMQKGQKIYNTVNKLFALSKYHTVGIMVYGNAEFMGVPLESIIKIYRSKLGTKKFDTLKQYADDFLSFLSNNNALFPEAEQEKQFKFISLRYFNIIKKTIDKEVNSIISKQSKVTDIEISGIVKKIIQSHYEDSEKCIELPNIPSNYYIETKEKYKDTIIKAIKEIFGNLPISNEISDQLVKISINLVTKDRFPKNTTGIVIAGFGEMDTFPSVKWFIIEIIANHLLKYKVINFCEITYNTHAWIIPFAQSEMVNTFVEGVHPDYTKRLDGYLTELLSKYPNYVVDNIKKLDDKEKQALKDQLKSTGENLLKMFKENMKKYSNQTHVQPIISAVAMLPKDELAGMAEALVNLTSFKRRISMEAETVGGPIDVAVISKGDGFIWIKRKHYFKSELNPHFFANYYKDCQTDRSNNESE
jgi:succinate dehydrogenase flavin-adding protein (antitoxin of CptAB toxin-antitoxin module)